MLKQRKKNKGGDIYPDGLDEFLVEQGTRTSNPGKLKYFFEMEEHPGWYAFIFEHRSLSCSIDVGIRLGLFVMIDENTAKLNPKLEEQLEEDEPK